MPYVMFWASDAASAAIDFSKGDVEDGVVDSHSLNDQKTPTIATLSSTRRSIEI